MATISGGALVVLICATIIDCGIIFIAFRSFLKKKDK